MSVTEFKSNRNDNRNDNRGGQCAEGTDLMAYLNGEPQPERKPLDAQRLEDIRRRAVICQEMGTDLATRVYAEDVLALLNHIAALVAAREGRT